MYATESFPQYFCALNVGALTGRHFKDLRTAGVNDDHGADNDQLERGIFFEFKQQISPCGKVETQKVAFYKDNALYIAKPERIPSGNCNY